MFRVCPIYIFDGIFSLKRSPFPCSHGRISSVEYLLLCFERKEWRKKKQWTHLVSFAKPKTCWAKSLDITTDRDERKQTPITEMSSINFPDCTSERASEANWANEQLWTQSPRMKQQESFFHSLRVLFVHVQTWCARPLMRTVVLLRIETFLPRLSFRLVFFFFCFTLQTYSRECLALLLLLLRLLLLLLMMCFSVLWTLIRNANLFLTLNIALLHKLCSKITQCQNDGKENDLMSLLISSMIFTHENSFEFLSIFSFLQHQQHQQKLLS